MLLFRWHRSKWLRNSWEILILKILKITLLKCSLPNKIHIFQCMDKIFCVEFQTVPMKFHAKYIMHTLKNMIFYAILNFKVFRFESLNSLQNLIRIPSNGGTLDAGVTLYFTKHLFWAIFSDTWRTTWQWIWMLTVIYRLHFVWKGVLCIWTQ